MVFPGRRAVILIHGCFWHGHDCHLFRLPATRREFWKSKIEGNRARDEDAEAALLTTGWRVLTIWECALKGRERLPVDEVLDRASDWLVDSPMQGVIAGAVNGSL